MTRFGFLSTYPPTRCGLATFSRSLAAAMCGPQDPAVIVRVLQDGDAADDPRIAPPVDAAVPRDDPAAAAEALAGCDVVIAQHEYGIYGGPDGIDVLETIARLRSAVIVVLHTVLPAPSGPQRDIIVRLGALASVLVVMTAHARDTLLREYDVDPRRVALIPHGVPVPQAGAAPHAGALPRIATWGLISPGKGLDRGIRALSLLREQGLRAEYVIAGQTHPKVLAHDGERYRDSLQGLSRALGVESDVHFVDRYLDDAELDELRGSADVVLLPYESQEQATSGVLVEAVASGVPVVATAFPHAVELLDGRSGIAVPHDDLAAMAAALRRTLDAARGPRRMTRPVAAGGLGLPWPEVAARYAALAARLRAERAA
ncbi:glycosyltransferase [Microbacterium ureisolvens]|uniref:glycosyltransferase n=1 Tax=Microbacterium ureisolvens TaxID=2781186 RepID=UPI003635F2FA